MLDINLIRTQPELIKTSLLNRQKDPALLDKVILLDKNYRDLLSEYEQQKSEQKIISRSFSPSPSPSNTQEQSLIEKEKKEQQLTLAKEKKEHLKDIEEKLKQAKLSLEEVLEEIPNIPAEDVPVGKDDSENVVIKTVGEKPKFDFKPLDHQQLGEKLNIIDKEKAGQISGSRFGYYKNEAAILEMSIMFYAMKKFTAMGFKAMLPPVMIKSQTEWGCGYASNKNLFNAYYSIPEDDLILISSSEHSVVPYHSNETLDSKIFPIKYVNFSPCFRRESGTYGKDMKGMLRVHHFNKVELNVFTLPDLKISDAMQLEMLSAEEEILKDLGLHYQVVNCSTGDLPQPNRRMYDINTWFPGLDAYKETGSCSNCADYQARRLNTKVKINGKNELVHILNSTAVTDRVMLAILENFQTKEGNINIPEVLWPFTGFKQIPITS